VTHVIYSLLTDPSSDFAAAVRPGLVLVGQITYHLNNGMPTAWTYRRCNTTNPELPQLPPGCYPDPCVGCTTPISTSASEIDTHQLLNTFTTWFSSSKPALQLLFGTNIDVAHLFTGANFASSTIGLAWVSRLCTNLVRSLFLVM
jgi:hypothetical protein